MKESKSPLPCPQHGDRYELFYDSLVDYRKRIDNPLWSDGLPLPHTCDRPVCCLPQAHYLLAYDVHTRSRYIYSKCIWHEDAILIANAMIEMRLVTHVTLYEVRYEPFRKDYICQAVIFLFEGILPARTEAQTWTDFMHLFRCLVVARGYVPRVCYDDTDEDLPVTSHSVWRPRRPRGGRTWDDILNLRVKH